MNIMIFLVGDHNFDFYHSLWALRFYIHCLMEATKTLMNFLDKITTIVTEIITQKVNATFRKKTMTIPFELTQNSLKLIFLYHFSLPVCLISINFIEILRKSKFSMASMLTEGYPQCHICLR